MFKEKFGIEIEFTGITRNKAAKLVAEYLGGTVSDARDYYDTKVITAPDGRKWKVMYDGSFRCQTKRNGEIISASRDYSCELVSPILTYEEDINTLQELVIILRKACGLTNSSCGIRVHLNGEDHDVRSIRNFINIVASKNDLLGPSLLKKIGAFFTPEKYMRISTGYVRKAISLIKEKYGEDRDYIILDRCSDTGNLEKFFNDEELSHCVLNTYDYTEWTTLKGLYDGRVRMIIQPTHDSRDSQGLLKVGDALSEDFINYSPLNEIIKNKNISVIILENPPFVDIFSNKEGGVKSTSMSSSYIREKMTGREN
jgi:hypothetical protein